MTVDLSAPLPAIQHEGSSWLPTLVLNAHGSALTDEMTLAHLVAVLAALTPEQLTTLAPYLRPPLLWTSNGEAGDGQNVCSLCDVETDEPHTLEECKQAIASSIDHGWSVVGAAMDETEKEKARADRAEQFIRDTAAEWRRGLKARMNGDVMAVRLVQAVEAKAEELEKLRVCSGCGCHESKCLPLWSAQRKCCPDCNHGESNV